MASPSRNVFIIVLIACSVGANASNKHTITFSRNSEVAFQAANVDKGICPPQFMFLPLTQRNVPDTNVILGLADHAQGLTKVMATDSATGITEPWVLGCLYGGRGFGAGPYQLAPNQGVVVSRSCNMGLDSSYPGHDVQWKVAFETCMEFERQVIKHIYFNQGDDGQPMNGSISVQVNNSNQLLLPARVEARPQL